MSIADVSGLALLQYYGTTSVSRWIRLKLYSFRISFLLLMSSKAISMASGIPAPHQDLQPVIGAIEPMYKVLPCVVKLSPGKLTASS